MQGAADSKQIAAFLGPNVRMRLCDCGTFPVVLFDFIEENHAEGEPFEQAVLDALRDARPGSGHVYHAAASSYLHKLE